MQAGITSPWLSDQADIKTSLEPGAVPETKGGASDDLRHEAAQPGKGERGPHRQEGLAAPQRDAAGAAAAAPAVAVTAAVAVPVELPETKSTRVKTEPERGSIEEGEHTSQAAGGGGVAGGGKHDSNEKQERSPPTGDVEAMNLGEAGDNIVDGSVGEIPGQQDVSGVITPRGRVTQPVGMQDRPKAPFLPGCTPNKTTSGLGSPLSSAGRTAAEYELDIIVLLEDPLGLSLLRRQALPR